MPSPPASMEDCCEMLGIHHGRQVHREIIYAVSHLTAFHKSNGSDNKYNNVPIRRESDGRFVPELIELLEEFLEERRGGIMFFPIILPAHKGYSTSYTDKRLVWKSTPGEQKKIRLGMALLIERLKLDSSYMSQSFWGDAVVCQSFVSTDCEDCGSGETSDQNDIVYCDHCEIGHHQACYDIFPLPLPNEPWLCEPCISARLDNKAKQGKKRARIDQSASMTDNDHGDDSVFVSRPSSISAESRGSGYILRPRDSAKASRSSTSPLSSLDAPIVNQQPLGYRATSPSPKVSESIIDSRGSMGPSAPPRPLPYGQSSPLMATFAGDPRTISLEHFGPSFEHGGTSRGVNTEHSSSLFTPVQNFPAVNTPQYSPAMGVVSTTLQVLTKPQADSTKLAVRLLEESVVRLLPLSSISSVDDLFYGCAKTWPTKFLPPGGHQIDRVLAQFEVIGGYLEITRPTGVADFVQFLKLIRRLWHRSVGDDVIYIPVLILARGEVAAGL